MLCEVVNVLEVSDVQIAARVVEGAGNPFAHGKTAWRLQADLTAQLLRNTVCPEELVCVCMDDVSTPVGESLEERVRGPNFDERPRRPTGSRLGTDAELRGE